jgi:hypothetical protein
VELIFITVPLFLVWIATLFDLAVRGDLSPVVKLAWAVAITLLWPTIIGYLLLRPVYGRVTDPDEVRGAPHGPRDDLVEAVMDHAAGRMDTNRFIAATRALRQAPELD